MTWCTHHTVHHAYCTSLWGQCHGLGSLLLLRSRVMSCAQIIRLADYTDRPVFFHHHSIFISLMALAISKMMIQLPHKTVVPVAWDQFSMRVQTWTLLRSLGRYWRRLYPAWLWLSAIDARSWREINAILDWNIATLHELIETMPGRIHAVIKEKCGSPKKY